MNKLRLMVSPLTKRQRKLLHNFSKTTIKIRPSVYEDYKRKVKDNNDISCELCAKKLMRNVILGKPIKIMTYTTNYQYGNLTITCSNLVNRIDAIHNSVGNYYFDNSKKQLKRKQWLNKYLGIE